MIDHSSCDHERTPKARAACRRQMSHIPEHDAPATKRARERATERPAKTRPSDVTYTRPSGRSGALRALYQAPDVVQTFIAGAEARQFDMNEMTVERGYSIEVYSARGAARVTWDGDEIAWFTRLGYTSITTRVDSVEEVWEVLLGKRQGGRKS